MNSGWLRLATAVGLVLGAACSATFVAACSAPRTQARGWDADESAAALPPDAGPANAESGASVPANPSSQSSSSPTLTRRLRPRGLFACLADKDGLQDPSSTQRRLADEARRQGVALAAVRYVVLVRDPVRSLTDPPPLSCRHVADEKAFLRAPLLARRDGGGEMISAAARRDRLLSDVTALLAAIPEAKQTPLVLLDETDTVVAVAIDVPVPEGAP